MAVHQLTSIELACHREAYKRACITHVKDKVAQVRHTHQTTARTRRPEIASTSNHSSMIASANHAFSQLEVISLILTGRVGSPQGIQSPLNLSRLPSFHLLRHDRCFTH